MESREMSESIEQFEKDVNLNQSPASSIAGEDVVQSGKQEIEVEECQTNENEQNETVQDQPIGKSKYAGLGKTELIDALKELLEQPIESIKDDVQNVKIAFMLLRKAEINQEKNDFIAKGNEESAFACREDEQEAQFNELLNKFKEKRSQYLADLEAARNENLEKKLSIIEQIESITSDPDNINKQYNTVKQLQQDFKEVGPIPATRETEIWKSFQQAVEKFYDLLKINKELRDYDFKKNLEAKQQLCLEAEELDNDNDIVAAGRKLQELHEKWREIGPVAKEIREELWTRFKNASTNINKKYQSFFEERKAIEKENAEAKTALCEKIEAINIDEINTHSGWDEATKAIIAMQEEWKKLGFASRKVNNTLFARFRKTCDDFFAKKAEFFKKIKEEMAANLEHKIQLCEKAEELQSSTDWKSATETFVALQKEWKTIGPVAKKHSEEVWKRFIAACDHFFEEKKRLSSNIHAVEHDNLKHKKDIISKINELISDDNVKDGAEQVRLLMTEWQTIGHVPFKEKDKVYADYREAVDKAFEKFDMKGSRANLANFESNLNQIDGDKVYRERERLVRAYEAKRNELKTYENNMGFLNACSKSGNSLVKDLEHKINRIKDDLNMLEQKIKMIDERL